MSPDASLSGLVLLDAAGQPDNRITVVDLVAGTDRDFNLLAPTVDGGSLGTVLPAPANESARARDSVSNRLIGTSFRAVASRSF